jgi:hypothetical protein
MTCRMELLLVHILEVFGGRGQQYQRLTFELWAVARVARARGRSWRSCILTMGIAFWAVLVVD